MWALRYVSTWRISIQQVGDWPIDNGTLKLFFPPALRASIGASLQFLADVRQIVTVIQTLKQQRVMGALDVEADSDDLC